MYEKVVTVVAAFAALSSANPVALPASHPLLPRGAAPISDPRFTNFVAPGPNDVRSPCPGLNSLANHGFLHHDGRNMTIPHLIDGLAAGLNVGADFATAIGGVGLLSSPNPLGGSFDLNDLDQHNFPIEHDASLSRQDAYFGNDYSFYQPNFDQVLAHFAGSKTTNISSASLAKYSRVQDSRARDPTFTYGLREFVLSYGETALYLQTMSDPVSGVARVDFIREFFEKERLPVDLGWRPSAQQVNLATLGTMIVELYLANPQAVPEGAAITVYVAQAR